MLPSGFSFLLVYSNWDIWNVLNFFAIDVPMLPHPIIPTTEFFIPLPHIQVGVHCFHSPLEKN